MTSQTAAPNQRLMAKSLIQADLVVLSRNRRSLVLSILLPLVILATTKAHKAQARLGGSILIIGLAISYGLMASSMLGYALSIARDRDKGVFQRLRVTPAPTWMIMASRLGAQVIANFAIALVVLIVGASLRHLNLSAAQYLLVLAVSILGGAVYLSIGQALVGLVKSVDTVNAAGRIVFIILILLGLFGLDGVLGTAIESVSRWSPVGSVMTLFSGVLNLGAWNSTDTLSVVACLAYTVIFAVVGIRWFTWESE